MSERGIEANGVRLCAETFGDRDDPAILLLGGMHSSMDRWDDDFCARLAAGLRFVIRYDHRDTGASTTYPVGKPPYSGADLAADAIALLDHFGVERAHLVGISMGGGLAQALALTRPERVASLTLLATSPAVADPGAPPLPPPTAELRAHWAAERPPPDWSDRAAVVDYLVEGERPYAGSRGWDEARTRALIERVVARTIDIEASVTNHAHMADDPPLERGLDAISAPTLVLHGTEDPLFPFAHGEALASRIPGAELLALDGVGHQEPPPGTWDVVVPALLRHTSGGWGDQGDRLARRALAGGDPTGWFDRLYQAGAAGEVPMPWRRTEPHPLLDRWARARRLDGRGRTAAVVGAGLGADAEYLAGLGFDTTGFDIAETAVRLARERYPASTVSYTVADLLDLPPEWLRAFDLVVEIITVQALPDPPRADAIRNVGRLVAPGGTLFAIALSPPGEAGHPTPAQAPPWPLARHEVESFAADGLTPVRIDQVTDPRHPAERRWQAEFVRPP